jgi:nitroreductase
VIAAGRRSEHRPEPYESRRLPLDEALERSQRFLELMRRRRSVRRFAPDPVSPELIENALLVAGSAPSGANQQPWSFVVVTDEATKARIRAAAEYEEELLYRERAGEEYLDAIRPIGTDWNKPHLTEAPVLIAVFEQAWRLDEEGEKRKHYYVRESVGIAVGFLLTALHLSGLATLTHAPSPMGFMREILGRPENERPFLLIPVGYPAADAEVPVLPKKSLDEITVWT